MFDHSPTAILAARGMAVRQVTFGLGFYCPPNTQPLPVLAEWRPMPIEQKIADESVLTTRINTLLQRWNSPTLNHLSELFHGLNDHIFATWPELDHYQERPDVSYFGTWSVGLSLHDDGTVDRWASGTRKKLFAYLKPMPTLPALVTLLGQLPVDALIVVDNTDVRSLQNIAAANVVVRDQPVPIPKVLQHCDVAILNGNHGSVAEFLLAGIPLLVIPLSMEQAITGKRLEAKKLGAAAGPERIDIIEHQLRAIIDRPEVLHGREEFQTRHSQTSDGERIDEVFAALTAFLPRD